MMFGNKEDTDHLSGIFRSYAQNTLIVIFGLLPVLFIPIAFAPHEYTKFSVVVAAVFAALVLYSLSVLRSGTITVGVSYPIIALWVTALITFISALLSGDFKDSLVGDFFSIHSAVFVALLALIPTTWLLLRVSKKGVIGLYMILAVSTLVLALFHVLRLIFGAEFLSLGVFTGSVSSPIGSWNDLALFLGLMILLMLIALEQLPLSRMAQWLLVIVVVASLTLLAIINFFVVWIVIGLTSLVIIVYSLRKDKFDGGLLPLLEPHGANRTSLIAAFCVFVVSVLFIIGGAQLGGALSKVTGISFVEVRPSFEATADIARNVYRENAFLGIGANKFIDAWRLYKDQSINVTPFWNTDFNAGNGYVTTFFVTTGVIGGIAWLSFIGIFAVSGTRRLLSAPASDKVWYFIAVSSFVSAVYIWGMSLIYVPGVVVLILGALCVGIALSALDVIEGAASHTISVGTNRRAGFMLTLAVITVIIGSVSLLYVTARHYSSVYTFSKSLFEMEEGTAIEDLERQVESAYKLSTSDVFARRIAEYQLARMKSLMAIAEPTDEHRRQFQEASVLGINAALEATKIDRSEPLNWSVLGGIYSVLAPADPRASEEAKSAFMRYKELNPKNPLPYLELAVIEGRDQDYNAARSYIQEAIALKPDFTDAFFFLSQLEVATGNIDAAVSSTQSAISLEPQNPIRFYQLGVLESLRNNPNGAIAAFERAVAIDQNYANARYLLALSYDAVGKSSEAKQQLEAVQKLNPDNIEVANLLKVMNEEGSLKRLRTEAERTIPENGAVTNDDGTVSTTKVGDSPLVTPVNTEPRSGGAE